MSEVNSLEVGQTAPLFSCEDSTGAKHDLKQYMAEGKT